MKRADAETLDLMPAEVPAPAKAKPKTLPTLFVPADAMSKRCRCGATIYMKEMPSCRFAPIHCDVAGGRRPTADQPGIGIVHFLDCPHRDEFRRGAR